MISPTGQKVRSDIKGLGHYGAARGRRTHRGTDYICEPGQNIVAPISGTVERIAYPYADKSYGGLVIQGMHCCVKLFYFMPNSGIVGSKVERGAIIGVAQDISKRHGSDMIPHIHLQIEHLDPDIFVSKL